MSYSRVIRECEARMVEDYIPYLQGECRQMVKDENRPGKYGVYYIQRFCSHRNCGEQSGYSQFNT